MSAANVPLSVAMMIIVTFVAIGLVLIPSLESALRRRIAQAPVNDNDHPEADHG